MHKNKVIVWMLVGLVVLGMAATGVGTLVATVPPRPAATTTA